MEDSQWGDEIEGWFWLPSRNPNKIRGLLATSWSDGVVLSLEEPLGDRSRSLERVYGADMAGRPVVLRDAFTLQRIGATSRPERFWHRLRVNEALLGTHRPRTRFPQA